MELDIVDRNKFKVSLFKFRNKKREIIGHIVPVEVIVNVFGILKRLVDIHEVDLMAHGMQKKFEVGGIANMREVHIEFIAENIRDHPFVTFVLLFYPEIKDYIDGLFFPGKGGGYFTEPVLCMKIKQDRGFFIQHLVDEDRFQTRIYQRAFLVEKNGEVLTPCFKVVVTALPGVEAVTFVIFFPVKTAEELVHLLGLGIKYGFIPVKVAQFVLSEDNYRRQKREKKDQGSQRFTFWRFLLP